MMHIAHSKPYLTKEELAAARSVILSGQLAQGPLVERLEKDLAAFVGRRYGSAVSSGTAALYCALRALGAGPGRDVIIPTYVCAALLNAVVMCGARPVLADVDPYTGNLTPALVKQRLTKKTTAVIVPHMFGFPADAAAIERLGVPVIEDCAQCLGTTSRGKKVGGLSAVSVCSFYATKLVAGGEGGMVVTSDAAIRKAVVTLREYDKRDAYIPAFNFKLSDLHAALALAQLRKLPEMVRLRREAAARYRILLGGRAGEILPPQEARDEEPVYYRFVVTCAVETGPIVKKLRGRGIECGKPVYAPLHRYLKKPGYPNADRLQKTSLSLPMHPGLTAQEVAFVARQVLKQTGRRP
ncbi:MAG: DegT/DnrJ/EryC1/StrS family aminotransferase [Chitinispirillaceae bacterium]|nr:DegT/DnrJ/EryC1/StrS family aminotransferase [Chitinispirillaceae bacterium]